MFSTRRTRLQPLMVPIPVAAWILIAFIAGPAMAGRNADGAMLLHVDNTVNYSLGRDYCTVVPLPARCTDLVTSITRDWSVETIIWMVGAFPGESSPGVTAWQVGVGGDIPVDYYTALSACGPGVIEVPDFGWPAPGTGTACGYGSVVNSHLFKMYWFAAGAPGAGSTLSTTNYPNGTGQAMWADDSTPPVTDICSLFGSVTWGGPGSLNCPPGSESQGACCFADGHCTDLMVSQCESQGGTFEGDGTTCATFECPGPTGACCFHDGHCTELSEPQCAARGGAWQGVDTVCSPNPCPQPTGACCFPPRVCTVLTPDQCQQQGGLYLGDGTTCDPNPCPNTGACCFQDGHCSTLTQTLCQQQGGSYLGDGSICDPNPCVPASGACCLPSGECQEVTAQECATAGGLYLGGDTYCDPNPCPPPSGACCRAEGGCVIRSADQCAAEGGAYQGDNTACFPDPCPGPTGACCFAGGSCSILTRGGCDQSCGIYQGDGTTCDPNPCPPRTKESRAITLAPLMSNPFERSGAASMLRPGRNAGGAMVLHVSDEVCYSPGSEYCSDYPLPATCRELVTGVARDPSIPSMIWIVAAFADESSPSVFAFQVGIYGDVPYELYEAWSPCGSGTLELPDETWPAPGTGTACAFGSPVQSRLFKLYWFVAGAPGTGSTLYTGPYPHYDGHAEWADDSDPPVIDICNLFGRVVWGGAGQNSCPVAILLGACCFPDGSCQDLDSGTCSTGGGTYQGDGTTCATVMCPPPIGACCFTDGHCVDLLQADCDAQGGVWEGPGTSCVFFACPPPIGACCFEDGSCQNLTSDDCAEEGGTFGVLGILCDSWVCPTPPTGACCVGTECTITTEDDCTGVYQGDGTGCDPNLCVPNPTRVTTWGRIKSLYR